jgi:RHS repeat-associated protein
VLSESGIGESIYGYTGEVTEESGLVYLRARYYLPGSGRFISRDTWVGDYKRTQSLNKWVYVEGNPVSLIDPTGHICLNPWAPSGFHLDLHRGCGYPDDTEQIHIPEVSVTIVCTPTGLSPTQINIPITTLTPIIPTLNPTEIAKEYNTLVPNKKEAFLNAVLKYQTTLPGGMSFKLLLAMGAAESGADNNWDQESLNGGGANSDGVLQVTVDSGYKWRTGQPGYALYNNSIIGYENNVRDAIAYLNDIAINLIAAGKEDPVFLNSFSPLNNGYSIRLMLHYNGGNNPLYTYRSGIGNRNYLKQTAVFLMNSPYGTQYNDSQLASDMNYAQEVLNGLLQ